MMRSTVKMLMVAVAILSVSLALLIVPVTRRFEYIRLQRRLGVSVEHLQPTDSTIDPVVWKCAHGWAITASWNDCFSPEHVTLDEMYRLKHDLDERLREPVGLDILEWIWARLGRTGQHGKRSTAEWGDTFTGCFPAPACPETTLRPPRPGKNRFASFHLRTR